MGRSLLQGLSRTLSVLGGDGITLSVRGADAVDLEPGSAPYSFPPMSRPRTASWRPNLRLNVMTRRGRFNHRVEPLIVPLTLHSVECQRFVIRCVARFERRGMTRSVEVGRRERRRIGLPYRHTAARSALADRSVSSRHQIDLMYRHKLWPNLVSINRQPPDLPQK
jgi:hypothetical protein